MNKKLIRKMQTAAGGPFRIQFTPEQIAEFENQAIRVPGTNNSGGNRYREEGALALLYQELEKQRKDEEIASRMEMRPVRTKTVSTADKIKGEKDEYKRIPLVVGMSGADPLLSLYPEMVGFNGIGALTKTGLWNAAKYLPTSRLGNWGRLYFVSNAFKNSFNGAVPTLTSRGTSLLYQPVKLNETGLTSLKFFERPTLSNAQELAGTTKWERNFKPEWHVANYPGYQLKILMKGSPLERLLSKNGTININNLMAQVNKASEVEKAAINKVLGEKFTGLKIIDYNALKKAVLEELIGKYNRIPLTLYSEYGMNRLGLTESVPSQLVLAGIPQNGSFQKLSLGIKPNTFTFESPRLPYGDNRHYGGNPIGHSRTYTLPEEPNILHVMESQSDWGQHPFIIRRKVNIEKYLPTDEELNSHNIRVFDRLEKQIDPKYMEEFLKLKYYAQKVGVENVDADKFSPEFVKYIEEKTTNSPFPSISAQLRLASLRFKRAERPYVKQVSYLHDNYLLRQLQENLRYAAENGLTKMRYPTSETAAKIEGYLKVNHTLLNELSSLQMKLRELFENGEISWEEYDKMINAINKLKKELFGKEYDPKHQTILKKYADFPKLFKKLFKDLEVRTVTDAKGNTWYEVDVPKNYLSREWLFKQGGKMNILLKFKNGKLIRKMQTAAGGHINLSSKDIENGANLLGEYFLRGLGTFGKVITAPFTLLGPTSATIYKSKELLAKERAIELKSEELLGKAMTWVSPLNYGTALVTGNGLNARKGEEEIASWSPAWLALGRAGELYVGPKIVKGVGKGVGKGIKTFKNSSNKTSQSLTFPVLTSDTKVYAPYNIPTSNPTVYRTSAKNYYDWMKGENPIARLEDSNSAFIELRSHPEGHATVAKRHLVDRNGKDITFTFEGEPKRSNLLLLEFDDSHGPSVLTLTKEQIEDVVNKGGWKGSQIADEVKSGNTRKSLTFRNMTPAQASQVIDFLDANPGKDVYVHCLRGSSRSGAVDKFLEDFYGYTRPKGKNVDAASPEVYNALVEAYSKKHPVLRHKQGGKANTIKQFKSGGLIRKMQTAAGGPLINESTRVEKPIAIFPKKINKLQLSDDNSWEKTDNNDNEVNLYPDLRNDKYVQEFFLYDYAPRFKRLNNFASQDYVNAALNIYKNTPINIYYSDNRVGGYKTGGERRTYNSYFAKLINPSYEPSSIYLNEKFKLNRPTLVHELTHAFRLGYLGIIGDSRFSSVKRPLYNMMDEEIGNKYIGSGYSNSEKNILNNTYNMKGYKINYDPLFEKGTTNTEVRFRLWRQLYNKLGRRPSLEETDEYIRTYDGEKLLEMIRDANAYGRTMYNNGMLTNLIKNALINVAQNNSNNAYLLDDQTYYAKQGGVLEFLKNGSGIHIKKKNRGKFTDYCGGKVTDECIRKAKASGNPTLVKRATFAANARKWKHKKGGKAFVPGASITDSRPEAYWEIKKKKKLEWLEKKLLGGTVINESPIVANHFNWMNGVSNYLAQKKLMEELKRALELLKLQQTTDMINNIANSVVNLGTLYLATKALNKNGTPATT